METASIFNLLVKVLPAEEASQVTIRATRKVLSAMCQMAFDEGYQNNNPIRSIRIQQAPAKPILVASHDQWRLLEQALTYPPLSCTPGSTSPPGRAGDPRPGVSLRSSSRRDAALVQGVDHPACMAPRAAPPASTNAVRGSPVARPAAGSAMLVLVLISGQL
jgi:hypothetical protein